MISDIIFQHASPMNECILTYSSITPRHTVYDGKLKIADITEWLSVRRRREDGDGSPHPLQLTPQFPPPPSICPRASSATRSAAVAVEAARDRRPTPTGRSTPAARKASRPTRRLARRRRRRCGRSCVVWPSVLHVRCCLFLVLRFSLSPSLFSCDSRLRSTKSPALRR